MQTTKVAADGTTTIEFTPAEARAIRNVLASVQGCPESHQLERLLAMVHGEARTKAPKPRDRFAVVYEEPTKVNSAVVADEIRCLDCQSITGLAGVFEPTLAELNGMADRHECLPRITKED